MKPEQISDRLELIKDSATELEQRILDPKTKEYFLRPAWNALGDVERFLLPHAMKIPNTSHADMWLSMADFQLTQAERQLLKAKEMVANYGTSLQLIG